MNSALASRHERSDISSNFPTEMVESAKQSCHGGYDCSQSGESASGPPALRPPSEQGGLALAERHQLSSKLTQFEVNSVRTEPSQSTQFEAIQVHDLVPGGHEVAHELARSVVTGIHLGDRAELGVGAKH